MVDSILKE